MSYIQIVNWLVQCHLLMFMLPYIFKFSQLKYLSSHLAQLNISNWVNLTF